MDDLLILIIALFCGDGKARPPDPVLLSLFRRSGLTSVSCVDPDERAAAAYPRLVVSGDEGMQRQSGDGPSDVFEGMVRLEIVTRATDAVPDELDLLARLKARATDLLLGNPAQGLPPLQGQVVSGAASGYNVSVFSQIRPTGRLPVQDPTMKRWGATYRVLLTRLPS